MQSRNELAAARVDPPAGAAPVPPCLPAGGANKLIVSYCQFEPSQGVHEELASVFGQRSGVGQAALDAAAGVALPTAGFCGSGGFGAGLRTLLTNGLPAVLPVALNEGVVSKILMASSGVSTAGLVGCAQAVQASVHARSYPMRHLWDHGPRP